MNKKTGLDEKDLKALCTAHGGACQATVHMFLLEDGKVATSLVSTDKLVAPGEEEKTEETTETGEDEPEEEEKH